MKVRVKVRTVDGTQVPLYASEGAAGFDLVGTSFKQLFNGKKQVDLTQNLKHSTSKGYINLRPAERVLIGTGLYMEIPEGYQLEIRSRSGLALNKGLIVLNSPGTIDADYRGEIGVILYNSNEYLVEVKLGERIAQAVLMPVYQAQFDLVENLSETERGAGGFGSTGTK